MVGSANIPPVGVVCCIQEEVQRPFSTSIAVAPKLGELRTDSLMTEDRFCFSSDLAGNSHSDPPAEISGSSLGRIPTTKGDVPLLPLVEPCFNLG